MAHRLAIDDPATPELLQRGPEATQAKRIDNFEPAPDLSDPYVIRGERPDDDSRRNGDPALAAATERAALVFLSAAEHARAVDEAPPTQWLARPVWPGDAYGIIVAEHKAGKTWNIIDLGVSVAGAGAWLDQYPIERPGRVVMFLGEGGQRKMLRRLRAVCEAKGLRYEDLAIDICFRAPQLGSAVHMGLIAEKLASAPDTVLVILDPLYLAARGAKGSSLFDMGAQLENIQTVAQSHGAALVVVHHWNQTGKGSGVDRASGAGSVEWGRVLASASIKSRHVDEATRATAVTIDMEFLGDEIPESMVRLRRHVWTDDPEALDSPMHYRIERLAVDRSAGDVGELGGEKPAVQRVNGVLLSATRALTVVEIGDILANDNTGIPLRARTIQEALGRLRDLELAVSAVREGSNALAWRSVAHAQPSEEGEKCL